MRPWKKVWVAALFLPCALFAGCADKKAAETLYVKALERYDKKDLNAALAFIEQSAKCDKNDERAKFLKAKIHFFQGRYEAAAEILLDLKKAKSDQKDIQLYLIKSLILDKKTERASEEIKSALQNDRGDWRLYRLASIVAAKEGNAEERMSALNQAARALEGSSEIYFYLANLWESLGVHSKAEEFKEKCLALDKGMAELF